MLIETKKDLPNDIESEVITGLKTTLVHGKCTPMDILTANMERNERQLKVVIQSFKDVSLNEPHMQSYHFARAVDGAKRLRNSVERDLGKFYGAFIHHRQVKMMNSDPLFVRLYGKLEDPMDEFKDDLFYISTSILRLREIKNILDLAISKETT